MKTLYFFTYHLISSVEKIHIGNVISECTGELNPAAIEQLKQNIAAKFNEKGYEKTDSNRIAITFFAPIKP